ncbi:hypothetical protein K458DRAFT_319689 [Lentithecium fluviatile CBS 122367]|uniref:LITAF domain-containing protein n=1 Tax=Lentithecium fluviatile CBS 122367 TaxID=1168545 RepID=A0A6G1IHR9_9PLEO|nr:hypothetical protein K458DRAFT_319689 [Lentithecium fluviatile CBS 122367]
MGLPPQEEAPAYDDVVHNHPMSRFIPSGSGSGYSAVPQDDADIERDAPAHTHNHSTPSPAPPQPETLAQTIAGIIRPAPKPHVHCETCDAIMEARERRANEKHCCQMVAWVFIIFFVCAMIFGIVIASSLAKSRRHMHG